MVPVDRGTVVWATLPLAWAARETDDDAVHATEPFVEGLPGDALDLAVGVRTAFVILERSRTVAR